MRLLGVDYGTSRIGIAIGSTEPALAMPFMSISGKDVHGAAKAIAETAKKEMVDRIVVGLPATLSGQTGGQSVIRAEHFIKVLKTVTNIPIYTEDERFTTVLVERSRKNAGLKNKQFDRDAAAASVILETHIDKVVGHTPDYDSRKDTDGDI